MLFGVFCTVIMDEDSDLFAFLTDELLLDCLLILFLGVVDVLSFIIIVLESCADTLVFVELIVTGVFVKLIVTGVFVTLGVLGVLVTLAVTGVFITLGVTGIFVTLVDA